MLEKLKQDITLKLANAEYFKGQELPPVEFSRISVGSVSDAHADQTFRTAWDPDTIGSEAFAKNFCNFLCVELPVSAIKNQCPLY